MIFLDENNSFLVGKLPSLEVPSTEIINDIKDWVKHKFDDHPPSDVDKYLNRYRNLHNEEEKLKLIKELREVIEKAHKKLDASNNEGEKEDLTLYIQALGKIKKAASSLVAKGVGEEQKKEDD